MKLSVGSGDRRIPGWTHLDVDPAAKPDILADITQPWPLESASVDYIFCEEVITQVPIESCVHVLSECRRILRPGGAIRILMPDLRRFLACYFEQPEWLLRICKEKVGVELLTDTAAEVINRGIRGVGPFMYDLETFSILAERAGFDVIQVAYGESSHADLRGLDMRRPDESVSIYLELEPRNQ